MHQYIFTQKIGTVSAQERHELFAFSQMRFRKDTFDMRIIIL